MVMTYWCCGNCAHEQQSRKVPENCTYCGRPIVVMQPPSERNITGYRGEELIAVGETVTIDISSYDDEHVIPRRGKGPPTDADYSYTVPFVPDGPFQARLSHTTWDERFLSLAHHIASWSKDPSTQVGAVIVDSERRVVSTGYNGPPRGTDDANLYDRDIKLMRTLHAEENAVLFARGATAGCTLFVTHHPCAHCAAVAIQAGIKRVVWLSAPLGEGWVQSCEQARIMFNEASVEWVLVKTTP